MSQQELESLEVEIDQAKTAIELRDELLKLEQHPSFKKIITEGYLEKEPVRLSRLKVDPSMQNDLQQRMLDNAIAGVGSLYMYLLKIKQIGSAMEQAVAEMEETREAILQEETIN